MFFEKKRLYYLITPFFIIIILLFFIACPGLSTDPSHTIRVENISADTIINLRMTNEEQTIAFGNIEQNEFSSNHSIDIGKYDIILERNGVDKSMGDIIIEGGGIHRWLIQLGNRRLLLTLEE